MLNFKSLAAVGVLLSNIDIAVAQSGAWVQCESYGYQHIGWMLIVQVVVSNGLVQRLVLADTTANTRSKCIILPEG